MSNILRQFIKEELVWNYWVRRPRNSLVRDVGAEIADKRRLEFDPAAQDFLEGVKELAHDIKQANTLDELEDIVFGWGVSAEEVIADYTEFERYLEAGDVENIKRMLLQSVEHWKREMVGGAVQNGMDYAALDAWTPDGTGVGERLGEVNRSELGAIKRELQKGTKQRLLKPGLSFGRTDIPDVSAYETTYDISDVDAELQHIATSEQMSVAGVRKTIEQALRKVRFMLQASAHETKQLFDAALEEYRNEIVKKRKLPQEDIDFIMSDEAIPGIVSSPVFRRIMSRKVVRAMRFKTRANERLREAFISQEDWKNASSASTMMNTKRDKKIREKIILMWTVIDRGTVKSRKGTTHNRRLLRAIPINMHGEPRAWVFENEFVHDSDLKVLLSAVKKSPTIRGNEIRLQKLPNKVFERLIYDVIDEKFDKIKKDYIESFQGALSIAEPEPRGALSPVTGTDSGLAITDDE